jgi:hypothetical protein
MPQRLLQNQKSLTKTDSQETPKSWQEPGSTTEAEIIDENWFAGDPPILTRTQFYGISWNLQAT